ncbi:MAG: uridine kinase [bacterium]|nr:uridine kinase [bacterium]
MSEGFVVGISGGSAAGKTTFADALVQKLAPLDVVTLNQDRYFRDWADVQEATREAVRTSNHPRAVLWDALTDHVQTLKTGRPITVPIPGTRAMARGELSTTIISSPLILVEGHLIFTCEPLRDLMDLKVYLDVDAHERVLRRMLRDTSRGNMDLEKAVAWYRRDVIPNFPVHTEPTRMFADLIVPFEGEVDRAIAVIASGISGMMGERNR